MRQQFSFERTPARFGLCVIIRVARPAIAGWCSGRFDALATRVAGVLAASVGMDDQARLRLAQRQSL